MNGSGSHVPGKTSRQRPPTALKLGSEDSQLSGAYVLQDGWGPVSCEVRTRRSGEVLCAKSTFFLMYAVNIYDPSLSTARSRVSVRWSEQLFCFLFSGAIIVGLNRAFQVC